MIRLELPMVSDGERQQLCDRLERAADLADQIAAKRVGVPRVAMVEMAAQCRDYLADIISGDGLSFALLRHFAVGNCEFIEARAGELSHA